LGVDEAGVSEIALLENPFAKLGKGE